MPCRPPCEVVNWNGCIRTCSRTSCPSTSLWGRELKCVDYVWYDHERSRPPCEVVNWNVVFAVAPSFRCTSTSLWGRELKYNIGVSFNIFSRRPPCEVVNWNLSKQKSGFSPLCRPPCEVVNWNFESDDHEWQHRVDLLVRSWIEMFSVIPHISVEVVDLLVRSWIEISAKAHGYELLRVDLLVRSWIEISMSLQDSQRMKRSTSLWGRELKYSSGTAIEKQNWSTSLWGRELKCILAVCILHFLRRRPPCEVVNWNTWVSPIVSPSPTVDLLVRSWIEIFLSQVRRMEREVDLLVRSWIEIFFFSVREQPVVSTSLWGRELKYYTKQQRSLWSLVDLLVRSWIEIPIAVL